MADKETRPGILGAVSDWLKLLALIVLVAEAVILAAMGMTPSSHPMASWYPVFMLLFLLVVVAGIVFDRYLAHKNGLHELSVRIGDRTLAVSGKQLEAVAPPTGAVPERLHVESRRGFQIELPRSAGWSRPEEYDTIGYLGWLVGTAPDPVASQELLGVASALPLGRMRTNCTALCVSHGDPLEVELTDDTTTDAVEASLARLQEVAAAQGEPVTDKQLAEFRKAANANGGVSKFRVRNSLAVLVMDKALAADSVIPPTAANLFAQTLIATRPVVDRLAADERTILYVTTQTWRRVLVGGKPGELTKYEINQFVESDRFVYLISITFSPQTQKSLDVWNELQKMMQSFRMLSQPA